MVWIVSVPVQVGAQFVGAKLALAPDGNPETLKFTASVTPETRVIVMPFGIDAPRITDTFPCEESEKLNGSRTSRSILFETPPEGFSTVTP